MRYSFAERTKSMLASPLHFMRSLQARNSLISFAEELPAEELFPLSSLEAAAAAVISKSPAALQYGEPQGYLPLREWLCGNFKQMKHTEVDAEQILLTTGSQQAFDLLARVYIEPGDPVLVEHPTSPGFLQILRMQGADIVPVEGDGEGISPGDLLRQLANRRPKLLLISPNFTNPTGILWSTERRKEVLEICKDRDILIVEDNSYGDLHFGGITEEQFYNQYPSLFALDEAGKGGQVLYIGSFSKTVVPALRTGWAAGSKVLIDTMVMAKQLADWQSSHFNQCLLHYLLEFSTFDIRDHVQMLNREYETRLKLMTELMKRPAWKHTSYTVPEGGMFIWVKLPEGLDSVALLKCSLQKGASFLPGTLCHADGEGRGYIRLNFTHPGRDELLLGMNLIGEAISEFTARS